MQIKFPIRNLEKVKKYINSLPRGVTFVALQAISEWLVGDSQSGLRHPEPYKYVTRKSAYGVTFFTDKQRRWFFWALSAGKINPGQNNRTGRSTEAWTYTPQEKGKNYSFRLVNDTVGGYWTRDNKRQARQLGKVGWWTVAKVVAKNLPAAIKAARVAVKNHLAQNKKT
jgi:hypothetical protein